jgi:hypothetical protein
MEGFGLDDRLACFCVDVGGGDGEHMWKWNALVD